MNSMPIDLATVDWLYVVVLAVFVFLATLIGNRPVASAAASWAPLLSALLFAAAFVFWTYYPHHLPLPTALARAEAPRYGGAAAPAAPAAPRQAAQPGHRHHAAAPRATGATRRPTAGALGLRRSVLLMFSHVSLGS